MYEAVIKEAKPRLARSEMGAFSYRDIKGGKRLLAENTGGIEHRSKRNLLKKCCRGSYRPGSFKTGACCGPVPKGGHGGFKTRINRPKHSDGKTIGERVR